MDIQHWIKKDGNWQKVDADTYEAFDGEKELRSPNAGLILLQKYLLPLRWM